MGSSGPVRITKPKLLPNVEVPTSVESFEETALDRSFAEGAFSHYRGFAKVGNIRVLER